MKPQINEANVVKSLLNLRDELTNRAFYSSGQVRDASMAEVVWKINSCLYRGYKLEEVAQQGTVTETN